MILRFLITLLFCFSITFAKDVQLTLASKNIANAQTVLLSLKASNIKKPKLTLMGERKMNLNFEVNPFKVDEYYALVPISYYAQLKQHQIIISYLQENKKYFKSVKFNVKEGNYKSETIQVAQSKVKPNNKNKQRTKKEYKEAMDIYKRYTPKQYWNSDFVYPMTSKITSAFGTKRVYNNLLKSYHSGTDFKAPTGTKIHAVNAGVVRLASDRYYAGNSVILDHGKGVYTCYFHLSKIKVKVGQQVKKNELLGLSGATGRVTGPHLHFSARVHGVQVDPMQLLEILNQLNKSNKKEGTL